MKTLFISFFLFFIFTGHYINSQNSRGANTEVSDNSSSRTIKAVIVGVSTYKNLENDLLFAHRDAISMYTFLKSFDGVKKENLELFLNQDANYETVNIAIRNTIKGASPNDLIIIYFAGHGNIDALLPDQGYLLMYDVSKDGDYTSGGALSVQLLKTYVNVAANKQSKVVLIVDACRSGKLVSSDGAAKTLSALLDNWNNTLNFVSCEPDQSSFEDKKWGDGHGVYTYYFLKGMTGEGDEDKNNIVEAGELHDFIQSNVKKETDFKQIPKFEGKYKSPLFPVYEEQTKRLLAYLNVSEDNLTSYNYTKRGITNFDIELSKETEVLYQKFVEVVQKANLIPTIEDEKRVIEKSKISIKSNDFSRVSHDNENSVNCNKAYPNIFATGNSDKYLRIWNMKNFTKYSKPEKLIGPHASGVFSVKFSSDGKYLISADWSGHLYIWDWQNNQLIQKFRPHNSGIASFTISKYDNLIVSSGKDKTLKVYNIDSVATGNKYPFKIIDSEGRFFNAMKLSNDKRYLFGISGKDLVSLKTSGSGHIVVFKGHNSKILSLALSSNGKLLCSGDSRGNLIIRNIETGNIIKRFNLSSKINAIEFDKTNSFIFVSGMNRRTHIIDVKEMQKLDNYIKTPQSVTSLSYSDANNKLSATTFSWESNRSNTGIINIDIPDYTPDNAFGIFKKIESYGQNEKFLNMLKAQLYADIMEHTQEIINPFIEGKDIKPSLQEINHAIRELNYAYLLYSDEPLLNEKLISKKLFLEINRTIITNDLNNVENALNKCDSILKLDPYATYPHNTMAELYKKLNKFKESKESVNKAINQMPVWTEPKANVGKTYLSEGNFEKAEKEFIKIIKLQPDISKGYTNLGIVYTLTNKFNEAKDNFEKAIKIDKNNAFIYVKYSELEIKKYNYNKAEELLLNAIKVSKNYYLSYLSLANLYIKKGDYRKADLNFKKAINNDSTVADIYVSISELELKRGRYKTAEKLLNTATIKGKDNYKVYLSKGKYYSFIFNKIQRDTSYLRKSIFNFQKSTEIGAYQAETYIAFADFLLKAFQTNDANDYLIKYFNIIKTNKSRSEQSVKVNVRKKVVELATKAKKINKNLYEPDLLKLKSHQLMNSSDINIKYKELVKNFPESPDVLYNYALYLQENSNYIEAINLFNKIIDIDLYYFPAYISLLDYYKNIKKRKFKYYSNKLTNTINYSPVSYFETTIRQESKNINRANLSKVISLDKNYYLSKLAMNNLEYISSKRKKDILRNKDTEIGIDRIQRVGTEYIVVKKDNKYGLMHLSGKMIYTLDYENYKVLNEKVIFYKNGKENEFIYKKNKQKGIFK